MIRVIKSSFLVLLWAVFALTAPAFAQGSVTVNVSDTGRASCARSPGFNTAHGREIASATTNEKGEASFAALPAAHYQVSVSKDGFETARKEVAGEVGQIALPIGVTLAPATQHET